MQTGAATVESSMVLPQKIKSGIAYDPGILLLGISLKKPKMRIRKNVSSTMLTAVLLTIAKIWKQPKYSSAHEWMKQLWYIYTWTTTQP